MRLLSCADNWLELGWHRGIPAPMMGWVLFFTFVIQNYTFYY